MKKHVQALLVLAIVAMATLLPLAVAAADSGIIWGE